MAEIDRMYADFSTDHLVKVGDIISSSFITLENSMAQYSNFISTLADVISHYGDEDMMRISQEYKICWELIHRVYQPNAQRVLVSKALSPMYQLVQKENYEVFVAYKKAIRASIRNSLLPRNLSPGLNSSYDDMMNTVEINNQRLASIDNRLESKSFVFFHVEWMCLGVSIDEVSDNDEPEAAPPSPYAFGRRSSLRNGFLSIIVYILGIFEIN